MDLRLIGVSYKLTGDKVDAITDNNFFNIAL